MRSGAALLRAALRPAAALAALEAAAPLMLSAHEREITARHRAHRERVAEAWRVKDEQNADEQQRKQARAAERQRVQGGARRGMAPHEEDEEPEAAVEEADRHGLMSASSFVL